MLELLRKKQKSTLIKLVFWFIIATFVGTIFLVWGKGRDGDGDDGSLAFTVNGTQVSTGDFQAVQRNLSLFYQNLYSGNYNAEMEKSLNLPQMAYEQLMRQILLEQEARRLDIDVSHDEVVQSIAEIPQFQQDGVFRRDIYLDLLKRQRMSSDDFEARQKRALYAEKTEASITAGVSVNDADVENEFRKRNEKVNLAFVKASPALFEKKVEVNDSDLEAFFAEHDEEFRVPEKVSLRYLRFEPTRYLDTVTFDDAEIERYYKRHINQYAIDEQVKAAHILIRIDQGASDSVREERRKLAEKVLDKARAGEDFAQLARKYSDDGSASRGGELGYFKRGSMVPAFEKAAFAMKPGDISGLVETQFGLHIIKAQGYIEAGEKPLTEVYDEVKTGLRNDKAQDMAYEMAMDAYNINRKEGGFDKAAADSGLTVNETGLFTRSEAVGPFGVQPDLAAAAFVLDQDKLGRPQRVGDSTVLFALKERQASHIPALSEVKSRVADAYRKQQSAILAEKAAAEILADLKTGRSLATLAAKHGLKVEETGPFPRSYGNFLPRLGENQSLAEAAFTLTKESPAAPEVYEIGGQYVVAALKAREEADLTQLDDAKREELRAAVLSQKQQEALKSRLEQLRSEADIVPAASLLSLGVKIKS